MFQQILMRSVKEKTDVRESASIGIYWCMYSSQEIRIIYYVTSIKPSKRYNVKKTETSSVIIFQNVFK
jgi:hypothetical protein